MNETEKTEDSDITIKPNMSVSEFSEITVTLGFMHQGSASSVRMTFTKLQATELRDQLNMYLSQNEHSAITDDIIMKPTDSNSRWCKWGFHDWSAWSEPEFKDCAYYNTDAQAWQKSLAMAVQKRFCRRCGWFGRNY